MKYPNSTEGAKGLLIFLKQYDRYQDVFNASSPLEQITKIQQAGYNPEPSYIDKIMNLIETNNLTIYDQKSGGGSGDFNGYKSFNNELLSDYLCPVKGGTVTSVYGWRIHPITGEKVFHHGTDIGVPLDTTYVASQDGEVIQQGVSSSMGNYIYIKHANDCVTRVMHLNKILTVQGQKVKRGDVIGRAGTTGESTGVHAHVELRKWTGGVQGDSVDPLPGLKEGDLV